MAAIDDLMAAVSSNSELRQTMASATTPEDAVKVAANAGYKVTSQDLLEAYKSKLSSLSDDELASISGGEKVPGDPFDHDPVSGEPHVPQIGTN
jgi:predicted ribosomally synthesized peptide with nif11-like leader